VGFSLRSNETDLDEELDERGPGLLLETGGSEELILGEGLRRTVEGADDGEDLGTRELAARVAQRADPWGASLAGERGGAVDDDFGQRWMSDFGHKCPSRSSRSTRAAILLSRTFRKLQM
jgi:hypothetical protein